MPISRKKKYILSFNEVSASDTPLVGGKNSSLGEMFRRLSRAGILVPDGFAVTAHAYRIFIARARVRQRIEAVLRGVDGKNVKKLQESGKIIRRLIIDASLPRDIEADIRKAYRKLSKGDSSLDVAVRSSATAEDLPDASFAGQQETFLNVCGEEELLQSVKKAYASLFTDRAISYRIDKGFSKKDIALSVGVQKMVRSDLASSGIMFTLDTESGFPDVIVISSTYGLGENIVQGKVTPDQFIVFKKTLLTHGKYAILSRELGSKQLRLRYEEGGGTVNTKVSKKERQNFSLRESEVILLARHGMTIERHYKRPMDMEWAKDGHDGKLYIVQARPETVHQGKLKQELIHYRLRSRGEVIVKGKSVGEKIATGKARVIKSIAGMRSFKKGEVLVTKITDPDWEPVMKEAGAIVTDQGGRTSHAAIVARELNMPAVVGTRNGSIKIKTGKEVTVSCAEGETGFVYKGKLPFTRTVVKLNKVPKIKTKVMLILGEPDAAFQHSFLPVSGVGLARIEFILSDKVQAHPLALINYHRLKDAELKKKIDTLTVGYEDKKEYYIAKLSEGVARIAAAFYPREVIVRFSDFKSNEYANLLGGNLFERGEENPMLGWRGASRYYNPIFEKAFALECRALKIVREEMGLSNVKVMAPFTRTTKEASLVLERMKANGISRGKNGLEVYMMVEIPSNVILMEEFAKYFDGFSIGSNDLTQLTLGLDRDSEIVSDVGDERNEAVLSFMKEAVAKSKKLGIPIGICGQAPSDFPEVTKALVGAGITSISVNPDKAVETILSISRWEKRH